jgi:hypothetical protein
MSQQIQDLKSWSSGMQGMSSYARDKKFRKNKFWSSGIGGNPLHTHDVQAL